MPLPVTLAIGAALVAVVVFFAPVLELEVKAATSSLEGDFAKIDGAFLSLLVHKGTISAPAPADAPQHAAATVDVPTTEASPDAAQAAS